jgi:hypothetical protein
MKARDATVCYLCGEPLTGKVDDDHVPPKLFYAKGVRRTHSLDLLTLPTHESCNQAYRLDEEYFVYSLTPLAEGSASGELLSKELAARFRRGENQRLGLKVLGEFEPRPGGLYLPPGRVLKKVDGPRAACVLWKITRGLYFYRRGELLSESKARYHDFIEPGEPIDEVYRPVLSTRSLGQYPSVFDYKARVYEGKRATLEVWAMLLWGSIMGVTVFHADKCACPDCLAVTS